MHGFMWMLDKIKLGGNMDKRYIEMKSRKFVFKNSFMLLYKIENRKG